MNTYKNLFALKSESVRFIIFLFIFCLSAYTNSLAQDFWQYTNGPGNISSV